MLEASRLIVVAGLPAAGKSTVIEAMLGGRLPQISEALELGAAQAWQLIAASDVERLSGRAIERAILHYDMYRPQRFGLGGFAGDPALTPVSRTRSLTLAVLWTEPHVLVERIVQRRQGLVEARVPPWRIVRRIARQRRLANLTRLEALYRNPRALSAIYDAWFQFAAAARPRASLYIDTTNEPPKVMSAEELTSAMARVSE